MNFRGTYQYCLLAILVICNVITTFSQDLVPMQDRKSNLFGYVSFKSLNWKIKPSFNFATEFANGSAVVGLDGKFGLIDRKGQFLTPPIYEYLYGSRFMTFKNGDTLGIMDSHGVILHQDLYTYLYYDEEHGSAILRKDDLYGYWDTTGIVISPFSIYEIMFEDSVSYFNTGTTKGFIDRKGNRLVETSKDILDRVGKNGFVQKESVNETDSFTYYNSAGQKIRKFEKIIQIKDSLIIYKENNNYGIVNNNGYDILPLEYNYISPFNSKGYAVICKDSLYGIIDSLVKVVVPLEYDFIDNYGDLSKTSYESFAHERPLTLVWKDSLCGLMDDSAKIVLSPKYRHATRHEDLFLYMEDTLLKVVSLMDEISEYTLEIQDVFHSNLGKAIFPATEMKSTKVGLVATNGKVVLQPIYNKIIPLFNTLFIIDDGKGVGLVDTAGILRVPCMYSNISILNDITPSRDEENILFDNYLYVRSSSGKFGVLDRNGKKVIDTIWNDISLFDDDGECFFAKDKKNKWKIIYANGKKASVSLDQPAVFENKIAIAKSKNKYGVIFSNGKLKIPFKFDQILFQSEIGYYVRKDSVWGLMKEDGQVICKPQFKFISDFKRDFAFSKKDSWGVLSRDGSYLQGFQSIDSLHCDTGKDNQVKTFSFSSTNGYDEITLDLLASESYSISSPLNNFILDSLKNELTTFVQLIPDAVGQKKTMEAKTTYKGKGIEIMNVTNTTATLNFYEEESENGISTVKERCIVYCWGNDTLKEVKLSELFQDNEYASFLNEIIASKLRETDNRIIPSQGNLVFFNPDKFQITEEGLILKINEKGLNYSMEEANEVIISYHDIESIAKKDGILREFYK